MKKINLREYQLIALDMAKNEFLKKKKRVCLVLPCRSGKSVICAKIAKMTTDKGNRVLFIVHRKELCEQIKQTFERVGVNMWLCDISMVQTVTRNLITQKEPQLIITDECHHGLAKTYKNIYEFFPKSLLLGVTATPVRLNGAGLGEIFESMVEGVTAQWLIDNNYMSDYDYYSNKLVGTDNLQITAGDYNKKQIDSLMNDNVVFTGAVENYLEYSNGKSAIIYCTNVANSKSVANEFNNNNIPAGFIAGNQNKLDRLKVMNDFKSGAIKILTSCEIISEGIDIADCDCCIFLRPTQSLGMFIQQGMRCLTYKEGKRAIILDLVGNFELFGLPTQKRHWSLKGKVKSDITTKQCVQCFRVHEKKLNVCPFCGYEKPKEEIEREIVELEQVQAELEQVSRQTIVLASYRDCQTFEELELYRKSKKYKFAWTLHKCEDLGIEIPKKYDRMREYMK